MENEVKLEERRNELVKIIESFETLEKSKEWTTLKELVFTPSLEGIKKQLINESLSPTIDTMKLYRLQGEMAWARKYNDTGHFIDVLKKQLAELNKKIK